MMVYLYWKSGSLECSVFHALITYFCDMSWAPLAIWMHPLLCTAVSLQSILAATMIVLAVVWCSKIHDFSSRKGWVSLFFITPFHRLPSQMQNGVHQTAEESYNRGSGFTSTYCRIAQPFLVALIPKTCCLREELYLEGNSRSSTCTPSKPKKVIYKTFPYVLQSLWSLYQTSNRTLKKKNGEWLFLCLKW